MQTKGGVGLWRMDFRSSVADLYALISEGKGRCSLAVKAVVAACILVSQKIVPKAE